VAVTEDDLATAALERSPSIDILAFVPFAHIDAHYRTTGIRRIWPRRPGALTIRTRCWRGAWQRADGSGRESLAAAGTGPKVAGRPTRAQKALASRARKAPARARPRKKVA